MMIVWSDVVLMMMTDMMNFWNDDDILMKFVLNRVVSSIIDDIDILIDWW